ncbi:MAG: NAD-dependent epimerase/dehydratase family protein [Deltaproteobacteria bacterium]|nr:NAD-dependent epimerase/dehydratase family protein [Deltaproteobacteria bacterium]
MRAFVTGGSGFVGRELIASLVAAGHEVVALARSEAADAAVAAAGATPARGDVLDVASLARGMAGADVVFHAAAYVKEWGPREDFERVNVGGTRNVLEASRSAGVRRVVHVSTEAVLLGSGPIRGADETRPLPKRAMGRYGGTKNEAERVVRAANDPAGEGLETVVIRPRFVWGRGDTSLLPQLVDAAEAGRLAWVSGGRYPTSTCHVRNLAAGALLAAERGRPGGVYFLTDGAPVEFRDFITRYLATQGVTPPDKTVPRVIAKPVSALVEGLWVLFRRKTAPPVHRTPVWLMGEEVTVDDGLARRELGYAPAVSVAAGLAEMTPPAG